MERKLRETVAPVARGGSCKVPRQGGVVIIEPHWLSANLSASVHTSTEQVLMQREAGCGRSF
eukprot:3426021-Amphidinium_carterae.1